MLLLEASGGSIAGWEKAVAFWNEHFRALEWDTDRRHQKSKFGEATSGFASLVGTAPADAWLGAAEGSWDDLWAWVTALPYMGRLSSWSMAEFARILLEIGSASCRERVCQYV